MNLEELYEPLMNEPCTHRNGTYLCWRTAGHTGPHRSWYRTSTHTGFTEWTDDLGEAVSFKKRFV